MTTAAKALKSRPMPRLAVAPEVRIASSQPERPAIAPARTKTMTRLRLTRMPARKVAVSLPPIITRWLPNGVLARISEKTTKQRMAIQAVNGRPSSRWMPSQRIAGARSCAERPPEIASTMPRTQM